MTMLTRLSDRRSPIQAQPSGLGHLLLEQGFEVRTLRSFLHGAYRLEVPWNEALSAWHTLRSLTPQTGLYPLLLESEGELEALLRSAQDAPAVDSVLEQARSLEPGAVLASCLNRVALEHGLEEFPPRGEWPEDGFDAFEEYYYTLHYRYEPAPRTMLIALLPTQNPWEAPALLRFGGRGRCPQAAQHAAVLRGWYERYGAEPIVLTRDVLECRVARPPQTEDAALALALEQFSYCDDIVYQGTGTLEGLAATLLNTPTWYFWWN